MAGTSTGREAWSDEDLARRAQEGDEKAFEALVGRYIRPAFAVAWEFTADQDEAEDLVQETFVRAARALVRYDTQRPFRAWLFTILRNAARNAVAATRRWAAEPIAEAMPSGSADALEELEREEVWSRVAEGFDSLSPMQQSVFRLMDLEGLPGPLVAETLGLAEGTVRTHLYRARQTLRGFLAAVRSERTGNESI